MTALRAYLARHRALTGGLIALAELVMLAVVLDSVALLGGPWVFGPLLPGGGLFLYWLAKAAGSQ